jgi:hypothetical protein
MTMNQVLELKLAAKVSGRTHSGKKLLRISESAIQKTPTGV